MAVILNDTYAYDNARFTRSGKTLVAEASDLGYHGPRLIYDDACDVGIAVRGKFGLARFYLSDTDMDHSGEDVAGWRFAPIPEDVRRYPKLEGWSVLIIND